MIFLSEQFVCIRQALVILLEQVWMLKFWSVNNCILWTEQRNLLYQPFAVLFAWPKMEFILTTYLPFLVHVVIEWPLKMKMKVCSMYLHFIFCTDCKCHHASANLWLEDFQIHFGSFFHDSYMMIDSKHLPYYFKGCRHKSI